MTLTIIVQVFSFLFAFHWILIDAQNNTTESFQFNSTIVDQFNSTDEYENNSTIITTTTTTENRQSSTSSSLTCEKQEKPYFLPHKSDSTRFYVCVKGHLFLLNCPSGYHFDSEADQCLRQSVKDHRADEKTKKPILSPHETNCGWYYIVRADNPEERVLNSCPMPQLFDIPTLQCQNYTEVKCKERFEPKDACDYQIRSSAHAYPCSYMPSCKNRPDGLYPDRLRDCRMYFRCTAERSSESYSCAQDTVPLGERFSFEEQRCLPAQYVECINDQQKPF